MVEHNIRIKLLQKQNMPTAQAPKYATTAAAGIDLQAHIEKDIVINSGSWCTIPTGIAVEIQDNNIAGMIFPRSGLAANHGITLQNAVGVIDADYRGEIKVLVRNEGPNDYLITNGHRIAQIVFMPIIRMQTQIVSDLSDTKRGVGGFGSTGK